MGSLSPIPDAAELDHDDDLSSGSGTLAALAARRRALIAFAAFSTGLVAARSLPEVGAGVWFAGALGWLAVTTAASAARRRTWPIGICLTVAMVCVGAGWFAARIHEGSATNLAILLGHADGSRVDADEAAERPVVSVEGMVLAAPTAISDPGAGGRLVGWRASIQVCHVGVAGGWAEASGRLSIIGPGRAPEIVRAGARIRAMGRWSAVSPPMNPGEPDRRWWSAQQGSAGTLRVPTAGLVSASDEEGTLTEGVESWRAAGLTRLRSAARGALESAAPMDEHRRTAHGVLVALLLGEYEAGSEEITAAFTRTGLAHILAISGFHLVVMAGVVLVLVRLTGDRGWLEPAIVAAMVLLYLLIVPANAPVIRSGVMVLVLLAAEATGRRYDRIAMLAWIAVALLIWRPMDLWSLGWQLSFGIVATLLWTGRAFHHRMFPPGLRGVVRVRSPRWRRGVGGALASAGGAALAASKELVSTSVLCWLVAAPAIAHHTGTISPIAAAASVVVVPLATVLLWLGFGALLVGTVIPPLAGLVGWALIRLADGTGALVMWVDGWAGVWRAPPVTPAWTAAATLGVLWLARSRSRWRHRTWVVAGALIAWFAAEAWLAPRMADGSLGGRVALRIDALSVGDGTCWLLRSEGEAVVWDCGSASARPTLWTRDVPRSLRALGVWRVRTIVVTGVSPDRTNGLEALSRALGVRLVHAAGVFLESAEGVPSSPAAGAVRRMRGRGVEFKALGAGSTLNLGTVRARLGWPEASLWGHQGPPDRSLAATIAIPTAAGERTVLLTGDAGGPALRGATAGLARVDVLEWPRGRLEADEAAALVIRLGPTVVVESGWRRTSAGTARTGGRWLVTGTDGAAWVEIGTDGSIREGSFRDRRSP